MKVRAQKPPGGLTITLSVRFRIVNICAISICGVCLALSTSALASNAQVDQQGTGALNGYVYCADTGVPARFASVRVQSISSLGSEQTVSPHGAQTAAFTTTALDGSFSIDGLTPGRYLILASLTGISHLWRSLRGKT